MTRLHIKTFQSQHYANADKRIKRAAGFAKRIWQSPHNSSELGVFNFARRNQWVQ